MIFEDIVELNQTIYFVSEDAVSEEVDCPICKGRGQVTIENENFWCPKCDGLKTIEIYKHQGYNISKGIVEGIQTFINNDRKSKLLCIKTPDSKFNTLDISYCFSSKEEAEEYLHKKLKDEKDS